MVGNQVEYVARQLVRQTRFTLGRVRELKNSHNSVTVQNRTHVYVNFYDHKDLGNHLLQLCPKVVKHPVYYHTPHRENITVPYGHRNLRSQLHFSYNQEG
jgi:hypothetical protein